MKQHIKQRKRVKLTDQQRRCVKWPLDQDLLIRGIPGSGKTTVLLERAYRIETAGGTPPPRILVLTFSSLLTAYVRQLALEEGNDLIEAQTFHGWGLQLLQEVGYVPRGGVMEEQDREAQIRFARNIIRKYRQDLKPPSFGGNRKRPVDPRRAVMMELDFLREEFSWIKGLGKDRERYMREPRTGRGNTVRVDRENREYIWAVYEKYEELNRNQKKWDFDDVALKLLEAKKVGLITPDRCPQYVLVDEAQDLTVMQLRAIRELTTVSLTIAADKGQSIYQRNFSWAELGIGIRGRSRSLGQTFRSTRQIIRLARSLQRHDPLVIKGSDEHVPAADPDVDGPVPVLYVAPDLATQIRQVVEWASRLLATPGLEEDTIGIIVPTSSLREKYAESLAEAGLPYLILGRNYSYDAVSPGIKLVTFHSAKGLEFDHVAVTSLKDGVVPSSLSRTLSPEDREEFIATERRKVYVAMTRARLTLALFAWDPISPFVHEMDHTLYRRAQ